VEKTEVEAEEEEAEEVFKFVDPNHDNRKLFTNQVMVLGKVPMSKYFSTFVKLFSVFCA
jgi:hypothetical protein